jgi:NTE family protein
MREASLNDYGALHKCCRMKPDNLASHDGSGHPLRTRETTRRLKFRPRRRLSLALQGGGSFGAFTWGVLDRLLDEDDLTFDVVSGASAGAVNAVLLASGLSKGGRPEAQRVLESFWEGASEQAPRQQPGVAADLTSRVLSPYQFNPFNLNPLRTLLADVIDFEAMLANPCVRLLVAATRVRDGKLRIFRERGLTIDAVLASACLPLVHHAVEIDGETYWDGGYSANPPLMPLIRSSRAGEALLVKIIPNADADAPTTSRAIVKRMEQITFNGALLRDLEAVSEMKKLSQIEGARSSFSKKLAAFELHQIVAEQEYPSLTDASALNLDWTFLIELRDAGRSAAERWLKAEPLR